MLGVDIRGALNLVGSLFKYLSPAFLLPAAIALGYGEAVWPFLVAGTVTFAFGAGVEALTDGKERIGPREGYLVVSLVWLLIAVFGALPYLLAEPQLSNPVDALFESMSGFSTTGASAVASIGDLIALDGDVAAGHRVDRRRRDHRAVPGRAAAPAHRRPPGAVQGRIGGPGARVVGDDPRVGPALRRALRRHHGRRGGDPHRLRLHRRG